LPHIPRHAPFTSVEWNRHRNLKTPTLLKMNDVDVPWAIVVDFLHAPFHAVTVCVPVTALHTT